MSAVRAQNFSFGLQDDHCDKSSEASNMRGVSLNNAARLHCLELCMSVVREVGHSKVFALHYLNQPVSYGLIS